MHKRWVNLCKPSHRLEATPKALSEMVEVNFFPKRAYSIPSGLVLEACLSLIDICSGMYVMVESKLLKCVHKG